MTLKALTVWQPWASLIAEGAKRFETRSWKTNYRGPIAIHAAKTWNKECRRFASEWVVSSTLNAHGLDADNLDLGCILAVGELTECYRTEEVWDHHTHSAAEELFGWYDPGRWAWRIEGVRKIEPLPIGGRQGLWTVPEEIARELAI